MHILRNVNEGSNLKAVHNKCLQKAEKEFKQKGLAAFTLAEILITLGIIGVVAAMTIPALMQKTNDKELVSATLKMGSTLSNALKTMEALDMTGVEKLDLETFVANFKTHFKTVNCTEHNVCLADGGYFDYSNPNFEGACTKEEPCLEINADVNGNKGPNKDGKDKYTFLVTRNGILPKGEVDICSGLDCTAYVLAEHKLWTGETIQTTPENLPVEQAQTPEPETPQETPQETPSEPIVANCSNNSENSCTQCNSGYYVSNGSCVPAAGKVTLTVNGETKDYYLSDVTTSGNYSPNGKYNDTKFDNYWLGAVDVCSSKGLRLPTKDELLAIYTQKGQTGVPTPVGGNGCQDCWYWSSTMDDNYGDNRAYRVDLLYGNNGSVNKIYDYNVLCVGN